MVALCWAFAYALSLQQLLVHFVLLCYGKCYCYWDRSAGVVLPFCFHLVLLGPPLASVV